MKRNDKYVFLYIYFTTWTIQRHLLTGWVLTNDTPPKNWLLWILALSFSARPLTGDAVRSTSLVVQETATKKKLHLANLTRTRMHQAGRNIQFLNTEWHVQNKRKKEI